jgi:para-nitrobenzyl esterase
MHCRHQRGAFLKSLAAAFLPTVLASSAIASQLFIDPMFGVSVTSNVQYGTNVDGNGNPVVLDLDIYQPTGTGLPAQSPAIVLMHGGFFVSGSKTTSNMIALANEFASRGYVAVSINYRKLGLLPPPPGAPLTLVPSRYPDWLLPDLASAGVTVEQYAATIAAAVSDQGTAVNWLAANAATYNINPDWIAAGGYSAGAVSSLLLGVGAVDGVSADVGAVFSMAGGLFGQEPFVDASDPGVYILHGTIDDTVPYTEVGFLTDALSAAGVPYESTIVAGAGHSSTTLRNTLLSDPDPFFEFMAGQLGVPVPEPSAFSLAFVSGIVLLAAVWSRRRSG